MEGQAALEYMFIVILVLLFMVPVWVYLSTVETKTATELSMTYAKNAVDKIASTADLIYSQGPPAKVKVSVYLPEKIVDINISNYTINAKMNYEESMMDIFAVSRARMNGTVPIAEGNYWIQIEAVENADYDVFISPV